MAPDRLIGIDFDNTIICYDRMFYRVAVEDGLIPPEIPAEKNAVRDYLRAQDREEQWTKMQGLVYGKRITDAEPYPGIETFLASCRLAGIATCIISHKTKYPYRGPEYDLHAAGYSWLLGKGLLEHQRTGLSADQVYFELTKHDKIARINALGCTHFIDDLPEILLADGLPVHMTRILFDPLNCFRDINGLLRMVSWQAIRTYFETEAMGR